MAAHLRPCVILHGPAMHGLAAVRCAGLVKRLGVSAKNNKPDRALEILYTLPFD